MCVSKKLIIFHLNRIFGRHHYPCCHPTEGYLYATSKTHLISMRFSYAHTCKIIREECVTCRSIRKQNKGLIRNTYQNIYKLIHLICSIHKTP